MTIGMEEDVNDFNPIDPLDHVSISSLYWSFSTCKYKFYREKLSDDKILWSPSKASIFGTDVHKLLEEAIIANNHGELTPSWPTTAKEKFEVALDQRVVDYIYEYVTSNNLIGQPEKKLTWKLDGVKVISIIDFVSGNLFEGDYCVDDWKTGARTYPVYPIQLATYHIALQSVYADQILKKPEIYRSRMVVFERKSNGLVKDARVVEYNFTEDQLEMVKRELIEKFNAVKLALKTDMWPKEFNSFCSTCQCKDECTPWLVKATAPTPAI